MTYDNYMQYTFSGKVGLSIPYSLCHLLVLHTYRPLSVS